MRRRTWPKNGLAGIECRPEKPNIGGFIFGWTVVVSGSTTRAGTIADVRTDGDGQVTHLLVAYAPDERDWHPVDECIP